MKYLRPQQLQEHLSIYNSFKPKCGKSSKEKVVESYRQSTFSISSRNESDNNSYDCKEIINDGIFYVVKRNVKKVTISEKYLSNCKLQHLSRLEEKGISSHRIKPTIKQVCCQWNLLPFLIKNIERDNINEFFPIQSHVIPYVISSEIHEHIRARDICVSAPTGSGKTLSYVIPVLNSLAERRIVRLRALVVLPNRDIATQVYTVFRQYSQGSNIKIGLAIGRTDFETEKRALILGSDNIIDNKIIDQGEKGDIDLKMFFKDRDSNLFRCELDFLSVQYFLEAIDGLEENNNNVSMTKETIEPPKCQSAIDILVCTPGRLMDHLNQTPGFSLEHLQYLVIDEADRLLSQNYQNLFCRVEESAGVRRMFFEKGIKENVEEENKKPELLVSCDQMSFFVHPKTWRRQNPSLNKASSICRPIQLRKFLFSATMTNDPQKLVSMGLINPKYFDQHKSNISFNRHILSIKSRELYQKFSLPEGLKEYTIECTSKQKPLVLLALIRDQDLLDKDKRQNGIIIVFTSSIDSTHRLARLISILWCVNGFGSTASIAEFSSALSHTERINLVKKCNSYQLKKNQSQRIKVVICSDGLSRGLDILSVTCVINFDLPRYAKLYVHRCGRTARAGKKGKAISILKRDQSGHFSRMRKGITNDNCVDKIGLRKELISESISMYTKCLKALSNILRAEKHDCVNPTRPLDSKWVPKKSGEPLH